MDAKEHAHLCKREKSVRKEMERWLQVMHRLVKILKKDGQVPPPVSSPVPPPRDAAPNHA